MFRVLGLGFRVWGLGLRVSWKVHVEMLTYHTGGT